MFLNLAEDPPVERIITPRAGLTLAEYLAFDQDRHVLVIMTDMTNYCEALREVSASMEECLAEKVTLVTCTVTWQAYTSEQADTHNKKGSITQMPILTMPNDDITHPIPDLTATLLKGKSFCLDL